MVLCTMVKWVGGHLLLARKGKGGSAGSPDLHEPHLNSACPWVSPSPSTNPPAEMQAPPPTPIDEPCLWPDQSPFVKQTQQPST